MGEFDLIEWIRQRAAADNSGVRLGIGDDAAVISVPAGHELVITTDTLNAGVHFDSDASAESVGHKALAVNLSDLAAMGATPRWALLSLSMPREDPAWLKAFIGSFLGLAADFGVTLVGGDTCAGELSIGVTAAGVVPAGQALTRSGANPGDLVVVSGCLGDAARAVVSISRGEIPDEAAFNALSCPVPRIALGGALIGKATSCIDISDGLLADLGHVASASGCAAEIDLASLPASLTMREVDRHIRWDWQLAGGDDYELCFTVPPRLSASLPALSLDPGPRLSIIGRMVEGSGIRCIGPAGETYEPRRRGFEHFR